MGWQVYGAPKTQKSRNEGSLKPTLKVGTSIIPLPHFRVVSHQCRSKNDPRFTKVKNSNDFLVRGLKNPIAKQLDLEGLRGR